MRQSFHAKSFEECALVCDADDTIDCDAFAFVIEDSQCYVGDLRIRPSFGVFQPRPRISAAVYTKHGEINAQSDRSIYYDLRIYDDPYTAEAAKLHLNPDSCEFLWNDGHANLADVAGNNTWIPDKGAPVHAREQPGVIIDMHNQVCTVDIN